MRFAGHAGAAGEPDAAGADRVANPHQSHLGAVAAPRLCGRPGPHLWADDAPTCAVKAHDGQVWVKTTFGLADPIAHWRQRLADGLAHNLGLVIAKSMST
jgi:hypothetical protein